MLQRIAKGAVAFITLVILMQLPAGYYQSRADTVRKMRVKVEKVTDFCFSHDGAYIVTSSADTLVYHNFDGAITGTLPHGQETGNRIVISPDGERISYAHVKHTPEASWAQVSILGKEKKVLFKAKMIASHIPVAFSADSSLIAVGWDYHSIKLLTGEGALIREIKIKPGFTMVGSMKVTESAQTIAFSNDGKKLLVASTDDKARMLDLTGRVITTFKGHTHVVGKAIFNQDESVIATYCWGDGSVRLWKQNGDMIAQIMEKGKQMPGYKSQANPRDISFSPDGKTLAVAFSDTSCGKSYINTYSTHGALIEEIDMTWPVEPIYHYNNVILKMQYSPDGKKLVVLQTGSWHVEYDRYLVLVSMDKE